LDKHGAATVRPGNIPSTSQAAAPGVAHPWRSPQFPRPMRNPRHVECRRRAPRWRSPERCLCRSELPQRRRVAGPEALRAQARPVRTAPNRSLSAFRPPARSHRFRLPLGPSPCPLIAKATITAPPPAPLRRSDRTTALDRRGLGEVRPGAPADRPDDAQFRSGSCGSPCSSSTARARASPRPTRSSMRPGSARNSLPRASPTDDHTSAAGAPARPLRPGDGFPP
jgi:hypothetical protein